MENQTRTQIVVVPPKFDDMEAVSRAKRSRLTKTLIYSEISLSSLILILGVVTTVIHFTGTNRVTIERETSEWERRNDRNLGKYKNETVWYGICCIDGSGIWGALVLVVTSILGMVTVSTPHRRCPRISFFVLIVISCVVAGLICLMHGLWAGHMRPYRRFYLRTVGEGRGRYYALKSMTSINCFLAFVHMICCICSASLWCNHWCDCCNGNSTSQMGQVVYSGVQTVNSQEFGGQALMIPDGTLEKQTAPSQKVIVVSGACITSTEKHGLPVGRNASNQSDEGDFTYGRLHDK